MLFCAVTYGGCGGSGGTSGTTINPSTLKAAYSAKSNDVLTGTLGSNVKISIANGAVVTLRSVTINGVDAANYT